MDVETAADLAALRRDLERASERVSFLERNAESGFLATTSRAGLIKAATDAVAVAGTATDSALVPANLGALRALPVLGQIPSSVDVGSGSASVADDGTVTFTGASSVSLNGVFDGLGADEYEVHGRMEVDAGSVVTTRLRGAGTDLTTGYYRSSVYVTLAAGPSRSSVSNDAQFCHWTPAGGGTSSSDFGVLRLSKPKISGRKFSVSDVVSNVFSGDFYNTREAATILSGSYDGLTIFSTGAGKITGTLKVVKVG